MNIPAIDRLIILGLIAVNIIVFAVTFNA